MSSSLADRYAKAEALLPDTWNTLVLGGRVTPSWIGHGPDFWYSTVHPDGRQFLRVEGLTGESSPAFDHVKVAAQLSDLAGVPLAAGALPLAGLTFQGESLVFGLGPAEVSVDLATSTCVRTGRAAVQMHEVPSPDRATVVYLRDHNLWIRDRDSGTERQLTTDGGDGLSYGTQPDVTQMRHTLGPLGVSMPPAVLWSADGTRIVTHRTDQRELELMHLVQSNPPSRGRPLLHSYRYAMLGDEHVTLAELVVIDVRDGSVVECDAGAFGMPYYSPLALGQVWWGPAQREVFWLESGRGARSLTLKAMDPATGKSRVVQTESAELPVLPHPVFGQPPNFRVLDNGSVVSWSDKSGWGHLYVTSADGSSRQLTFGDWVVVDLVAADDEYAYFTGAGREPGHDPYARSFYRVGLHAGSIEVVASDGMDHMVGASPDGSRFVDVVSWIDAPAVSRLLDPTGVMVAELSVADATRLFEAGYVVPERVVAKAADGETDVYGLIYVPDDFDPTQNYPVLDDSYPGPQIGAISGRFPRAGGKAMHDHAAAMAALGFVVVVIDARGTPRRSKAFAYANRGVDDHANLHDHVAAIKELAATRPWMDLDRVGIYGHSGGGYEAAKGLMLHPEFFKVAVAAAGGHDARIYHAVWGETFVGDPGDDVYVSHAVEAHVQNLLGRLLLIHGELDDNVTPHVTLRLVDALINADKDFDLLIVPGEDHNLLFRQHYWWRRRWDYFVEHLLCMKPPKYSISPRPLDFEVLAGG